MGPSWVPVGSQLGPSWAQVGPQLGLGQTGAELGMLLGQVLKSYPVCLFYVICTDQTEEVPFRKKIVKTE